MSYVKDLSSFVREYNEVNGPIIRSYDIFYEFIERDKVSDIEGIWLIQKKLGGNVF